ncbi:MULTISPECIES: LytTR family DNA-binding domain-containing protein [Emticicia]|uniref:LytR/AlgR family response regulator transcription factor n=1 Tax=Emticicia TaxID=312278 RepID=UPI0007D8A641|nr:MULTISPECIES: LytTR family DNA-binding domain-containing protein [Emticicia]
MNCIIIEDDFLSQQTLIRNCKAFDGELNILGVFETIEAARTFIEKNSVKIDVIFLDIILPDKNGLDFLAELPIMPYVIITTAYDIYAVQAFEFNVVDYLRKPFTFRRFMQAMEKVKKMMKLDNVADCSGFIVLKDKGRSIKVPINDIDYVESYSDYVKIFVGNECYVDLASLKSMKETLSESCFIQVHRRFLANKSKIISVEESKIILSGNNVKELPLSRAQRKQFLEFFLNNK